VCSPSVWRHNVRAFSELVAFGVDKAWRGRSGPGRNGRIGPTRSSIGSTPCSYREGRTPNSVLDTTAMYRRIPRYCRLKQLQKIVRIMVRWLKGKGSPTRLPSVGFRSWSRFLACDVSHKPGGRLLPISLHGEQRHDGCEQFAQDCYLTASRLWFEPRPFCAWVQHANHSATEPPWLVRWLVIGKSVGQ